MSKAAQIFMQDQRPPEPPLPAEESSALATIQRESAAHGATLHSGGRGGLPPSKVLGVFRRDEWRCHRCGGKHDLSIHHKGGVLASRWLERKGHSGDPNNLVTMCKACHDTVHQQARAEGVDSSQQERA